MPPRRRGRTDRAGVSILEQPLDGLFMQRLHGQRRAIGEFHAGILLRCSIMLQRNIAMARFTMKINLHVPGVQTEAALSNSILPVVGAAILLTGLAVLPASALFLAALTGATGLGVSLAELRRHGGPDVPALPILTER
ncbi:hypothetical protein E2C06_05060 [Dankookia rubra]|uniref:Uncharacterized protein n=1 Tax=Dankookia rubra TaxID=1442381 RepID=A0A4R5QLU4_9PROT|nr:hypothetical protein [Dankookia rubra]TDH63697.1 hypothetical protein E2C06_05060 [Dankookia rubra]